jgi:hypothetical protein
MGFFADVGPLTVFVSHQVSLNAAPFCLAQHLAPFLADTSGHEI